MHNVTLAFEAIWKVLLVGLVLGAGLPTLFAAGVRFLAWGQGGAAEVQAAAVPHPLGRALAAVCFAVVLAGVALGILYVVVTGMGNKLSFENIYPTISSK
jgi:hypothetical protein